MTNAERRAFAVVRERKRTALVRVEQILTELRKDGMFSSLEKERDTIAFEISKKGSLNEDTGSLKGQYDKVLLEISERIRQLGYSEDDLTPRFFCPLCRDTGMADGANCRCIKEEVYRRLREDAGTLMTEEDDFLRIPLDAIDADKKKKYKNFYGFMAAYAADYPDNAYRILCLTGPVGTGKTYALSVLANAVMKKGASVLMLTAQQLNAAFLKFHLAPVEDKDEVYRPLTEVDLLIIDDLGTEPLYNNVTINYLYSLLADRRTKHTAITTNHTITQLEDRYGQRIFSRLTEKGVAAFIELDNSDLRK